MIDSLTDLLKSHFGYDSFLPSQEDIITSALGGRDCFVLMPTGGGKSLCYQLPAMALPGLTLVVSPLIALMKDQADALEIDDTANSTRRPATPPNRRPPSLRPVARHAKPTPVIPAADRHPANPTPAITTTRPPSAIPSPLLSFRASFCYPNPFMPFRAPFCHSERSEESTQAETLRYRSGRQNEQPRAPNRTTPAAKQSGQIKFIAHIT